MKITISTNTIAKTLNEVSQFAPTKSAVAILKFAKFTAKGNRIKIEANDMQCSICTYVEAESIDVDGEFLIDPVIVGKYIEKIKDTSVNITVNGSSITIKHCKGESTFSTYPVAEYPDFSMPMDDVAEVNISARTLGRFISESKDFVGTDILRPQITPIYAYIKDGMFGVAATDKRRLYHNSEACDDTTTINWYIEQPLFSLLIKACANGDNVIVKITPTHVSYRIGNTILQSLQTKGKYPNFERVIPKDWNIECAIDRSDIIDSLTRVAMTSDNNTRLVKLKISQMDVTITTNDVLNLNSSTETIVHNGCNGECLMGFQVDHLLSCLKTTISDELYFCLTDKSRPLVIHQKLQPNAEIVLMPMNI